MITTRALTRAVLPAVLTLFLWGCDREPAETLSTDSESAAADARSLLAGADNADGEALYAGCAACHGADGAGIRAMNAPSLLAQEPWYLKRQLLAFRSGLRGAHPQDPYGAQMAAIARTLPDEVAIDAVLAYIDGLPEKTPAATVEGDIKKGADYYSMVCGSCHGPRAEGNRLLDAPALAGVDGWYLLRQFEHFRAGIRGTAEGDRFGRQMVMMAPALPDEAVTRHVVAYIQSLAD